MDKHMGERMHMPEDKRTNDGEYERMDERPKAISRTMAAY